VFGLMLTTLLRPCLDRDDAAAAEAPVCIFNVPKALLASDPDSYTPQEVALRPFHYLCLELYEMERYKLATCFQC
jgi:hypothetical protein